MDRFADELLDIQIVLPRVRQLRLCGAGSLHYETVAQDELLVAIDASGAVRLEGAVRRFRAHVSGAGHVHAENLTTQSAELQVGGSGSIKVHAAQDARARVHGTGQIKILGYPARRDTDVSGLGRIWFGA